MEIQGVRVLVTGGGGFLGQHLVRVFREHGAEVIAPARREYDLTVAGAAQRMMHEFKPRIVVHAAGNLGGIQYNRLYPAQIFRDNLLMTVHVLDACAQAGGEKLVNISSACAYPGTLAGPFREDDLFNGPMDPSVENYGLSKRALLIGGRAYQQQFGLRSIHLVLANLYGPGDKFDPEYSHVMSSMIPRFARAAAEGAPEVVCWGTGKTVREFLYVEDCAEAVLLAMQSYDGIAPLNVGTGVGTTIRELAELIKEATGFQGRINWDTSRPDGAGYKVVDTTRIRTALGWTPRTSLREGLARTVAWYRAHVAGIKDPARRSG